MTISQLLITLLCVFVVSIIGQAIVNAIYPGDKRTYEERLKILELKIELLQLQQREREIEKQ